MGSFAFIEARLGHERRDCLRLCGAHHSEGGHLLWARLQHGPRAPALGDPDHHVLGTLPLQLDIAVSDRISMRSHNPEALFGGRRG